MSDKKSKGGKKGKKAAEDGGDEQLKGLDKQLLDEVTIQVYEAKTQELNERLARYKQKCDALLTENLILGNVTSKFSQDRQDIVEFLNIKVQEHEKHICSLEQQVANLENEKRELEANARIKLDQTIDEKQQEIEQMHIQCAKYKTDLDQLSEFRGRKEDMEMQIRFLKNLVESKEKEHKDIIHTMERKILQDKNVMKKEMLQKVNEAVANFRRVADQQMAETTKRAIRENMAITSQLKKMSTKTVELLADNEALNGKVAKLKMENSLLVDSEKDLARKNQANQRVIKMLVEKIKESDKMIEIAYDAGALGGPDENGSPVIGTTMFDDDQITLSQMKEQQNIFALKIASDIKAASNKHGRNIEAFLRSLPELSRKIVKQIPEQLKVQPAEPPVQSGMFSNFTMSFDAAKPVLAPINKQNSILDEEVEEIEEKEEEYEEQPEPKDQDRPKSSKSIRQATPPIPKTQRTPIVPKTRTPHLNSIIKHIPSTRKILEQFPTAMYASSETSDMDIIDDLHTSRGIQTLPQQFAQSSTNPSQLLSDLRPWGPAIGLYCPRSTPVNQDARYYYPKTVELGHSHSSEASLFGPTESTTVLFANGSNESF